MKPTLVLQKFKGLRINEDEAYINDTDLTEAKNVQFDNDGFLVSRGGISLQSVTPYRDESYGYWDGDSQELGDSHPTYTSEEHTFYAGRYFSTYDPGGTYEAYLHLFQIGEAGTGKIKYAVTKLDDLNSETADYSYMYTLLTIDPTDKSNATPATPPFLAQTRGVLYEAQKRFAAGVTSALYFCDGWRFIDGSLQPWNIPVKIPFGSMKEHKDRFFLADKFDPQCRMYFSKAGDPETWDVPDGGFIDVNPYDGDYISEIVSFRDSLYIFKTNSFWVLHTSGTPESWVLRRVLDDVGCYGHTPVEHSGAIYWVAPTGVYSWDGHTPTLLSDPIQFLFENNRPQSDLYGGWMDGNYFSLVGHKEYAVLRAAAYQNEYVFMMMTETGHKEVFCYNIKHRSWTQWEFEGHSMDDIDDIFSVETNSRTNHHLNGFYITFKSREQWGAVFRVKNDDRYDYDVQAVGIVRSGIGTGAYDSPPVSTSTLIYSDATINYDLTGYAIKFYSFNTVTASDNHLFESVVTGNTTGDDAQITIQDEAIGVWGTHDLEPPTDGYYFVIFKRMPFEVVVKTKNFDFDEASSFKKFKKIIVEARLKKAVIDIITYKRGTLTTSRTVNITSDGNIGDFAVDGNSRKQNVSIKITVADTSSVRFKLYGIFMWLASRGKVGEQYETDDSSL